jgi:ABC-type transporter Mla maintaining outer membrane lipid asymmetry ATPase subunit MlaF
MLSLESVQLSRGGNVLFSDIDLKINAGDVCCIRTGSLDGATTLLECMAGLYLPDAGVCTLDAKAIGDYSDLELVDWISLCYEDAGLVSLFNVFENIVLPLVYHHNMDPGMLSEQVDEICGRLFISDCLGKSTHELNDVQTRLVNLARALLTGSRILLMDELQEGMSDTMRQAVLSYLLKLRAEKNLTLIFTTTAGDETGFANRIFSIKHRCLEEEF